MTRRFGIKRPEIIAQEIRCVECGYDLRGIARRGQCPECATPIKRSLAGPLLRHAGTQWLRRVHRGLWILHRASVITLILSIAAPIIELLIFLNGGRPVRFGSPREMLPLLFTGWAIAAMLGIWLATSPDPADPKRSPLQTHLERVVLLSVPPVMILWIILCASEWGLLAWWGIAPIHPNVAHSLMVMAFVATWLQSRRLSRWLNRIDARVAPEVKMHRTILERINEDLLLVRRSSHFDAEDWRWFSMWAPAFLPVFAAWFAWRGGAIPWWMLTIIALLPVMLLLTMRKTVRNVGLERSIGAHESIEREDTRGV